MILLERLIAHEIGAIDHAEIHFTARGHLLIASTPEEALGLRNALRFALFGDEGCLINRTAGSFAAISIVAGGTTYEIERHIGSDLSTTTYLARGSAAGLIPIEGVARVNRELDLLFGTNLESIADLIWPPPSLQPIAERLGDVVRGWLGSHRMNLLDATIEINQDSHEVEKAAQLRVDLAKAAQNSEVLHDRVHTLELNLKHSRVAKVIQVLERSESVIDSSGREQVDMAVLADRFQNYRRDAEQLLVATDLLSKQAIASNHVKAAKDRRSEIEHRLAKLNQLRTTLTEHEHRLNSVENALANYQRAKVASAAADHARTEIQTVNKEVTALANAQHELASSRLRMERLAKQAARAHTMSTRAHENAHLPTALDLWGKWIDCGSADDDLTRATEVKDKLRKTLVTLESTVQNHASRDRVQSRRVWLAGSGTIAGIAAGVLGLTVASPLAPVGLAIGITAGIAGIWTTASNHDSGEDRRLLSNELETIERSLKQTELRQRSAKHTQSIKQHITAELQALNLEVPTTKGRAITLRDSATSRLRKLASGDRRQNVQSLKRAWETAVAAANDAERDVRRLEARVKTLSENNAQTHVAQLAMEIRVQIEKSHVALEEANRLSAMLHIKASFSSTASARQNILRTVQDIRSEISTSADTEMQHQLAMRDESQATENLREIESAIATCHVPTSYRAHTTSTDRTRIMHLAHLTKTLTDMGYQRANAAARVAGLRERTARTARRRHTTDLAVELRSLGVESGSDPTASEARATIPNLSFDNQNTEKSRDTIRKARQAVRRNESHLRALELKIGTERHDIDLSDAKTRLDQAVHTRRVCEAGQEIAASALKATIENIPRIVEHELRTMLPVATAGQFWDARLGNDLSVELWDSEATCWCTLNQLSRSNRERVERALALAFIASAPPLDACDLPAFLWLDQSDIDRDSSIVHDLVNAAKASAGLDRYPQIIAATRAPESIRPHFDRVVHIVDGSVSNAISSANRTQEAG